MFQTDKYQGGCLVLGSLGWGWWGENVVDHIQEVWPIVNQGMIQQMKDVHPLLSFVSNGISLG